VSPDEGANFDGCITESWDALHRRPVFSSASLNKPRQPLIVGAGPESRGDRLFVTSDALAPDGVPWAAFQCAYEPAWLHERIGSSAGWKCPERQKRAGVRSR
jgi:hypothetical protein